jgi:putative hemolysin
MDSIWLLLLLQVFLIFLNAIFACAEIAVLSVNETKLERMASDGNGKAKRLFRLTREPARFLATIQVAITLSGFLGSAFAADNFSEPLVDFITGLGINIPRRVLDSFAVILITLILSYFSLVFGELVPKRIAMRKSEQIAMGISGIVSGISVLFKPIVWLLSASTNIVLRIIGIDPNEEEEEVSEEEIRMMVDVGSEKGTIDHQEKEFIQNVFEFNDTTAGDIATHRTDVIVLWMEDDIDVWDVTIHESRYTLYPVCEGSPDKIKGILNAKDYFRLKDKSKENVLKNAVHPAYFVPDTLTADVLFRNMKKTRNSMAAVMDEYGGLVGIVTFNDLIEELVGDLNEEPESQIPEPHLEKIDENTYKIYGNIELEELEEATGLKLATEDYDTFSGLIFDAMGAIPDDGDEKIMLDLEPFTVEIEKVESHQIESAVIKIKKKPDKDKDEDEEKTKEKVKEKE